MAMLLFVIVYLPLCMVCSWVAAEKNRSGMNWFLISLFFSPLVGLIALAAVPARTREQVVLEKSRPGSKVGFYGMNY